MRCQGNTDSAVDSRGVREHTGSTMISAAATRVLCTGVQFIASLVLALSAQAQGAAQFDNLVRSPYVHCAFYKQYEIDARTGNRLLVEGHSDSLTHYQRLRGTRVSSIDTRRAGAADVQVLHGDKYLHFIEYSAGMYVVTTVYACLERDAHSGTCINYGAVNARHFDSRVLRDPDRVYEELQAYAEPGFCDHSFINVQEALRTPLQ